MAIPAHTATTYSGAASPLKDMTIVAMASHTHAATTEERASYGGSVVYRSDNWEEPTEGYFNSTTAPLVVKAGTTLSWACDINNTTDGVLRYSDHALTAEMCNLTGFVKGTTPWAVAAP
jgi:hypothetical protein